MSLLVHGAVVDQPHQQVRLGSSASPAPREIPNWLVCLSGGGNSASYNQSGGNVLTWKIEETESYQNDIWGMDVTERWYAGGVFGGKNDIVCAPGTCPILTQDGPSPPRPRPSTTRMSTSIMYPHWQLPHLEHQRQDPALCQCRQCHQHPPAGYRQQHGQQHAV